MSMTSIETLCRPPEEGLFFLNFKFYFPGARHDGRAVFGGYEAAERAEFLGGRGDGIRLAC